MVVGVAGAARADDVAVRRGTLAVELVEVGEVQAVESRSVAAPMEWREALQIIEIVEEGSVVEADQVLVRFDDGFLAREIDEVTAEVQNDEAELRRVIAEQGSRQLTMRNAIRRAEFSQEQWTLSLEKMEFESESKRRDAELSLKKAGVSLEEARAKLASQHVLDSLEVARVELKVTNGRARLDDELKRVEEMVLRAPIGGLVVYGEQGWSDQRRKIRFGDEIHAGTKVIHIPNLDAMEVVFQVHEVDRQKVSIGMRATLALESDPARVFTAAVTHIARLALAPESGSLVRCFEIRARIDGADPALKPGSTAMVRLALESAEGLLAPAAAVFERAGVPCVFPRATWPKPANVTLGAANVFEVQLQSGVEEGALLAIAPPERAGAEPLGASAFRRVRRGELAAEAAVEGER